MEPDERTIYAVFLSVFFLTSTTMLIALVINYLSIRKNTVCCCTWIRIDSDTEYYREYRQMYMDQYENCDCIMIASPTGGYQMGTSSGIQEVQIERVLRGDQSLKGDTAWIDGMPGLAYYEDEDKTRIDALLNYMQEGNEYLIFCEPYISISDEGEVIEMEEEYYHTDCFFGYLNITKRKDTGVILDINKSYTYEELEGYEFFGGCQSVLDVKQEIKDALLEEYLKE